jgi:hypothetical protein
MDANFAALAAAEEQDHPPIFSNHYLTALLARHNHMHDIGDGTPNEVQHFAFAASSDDTLHHGQVKRDVDHHHYEKDMQREVAELLQSNSIAVMRRSALPAGVLPIPAIC